ncbi:hypothetical protein DRP07_00080 [Archaeoglobales archaeon]|mgnify:CR=1 FL=1|nr:MAG: hypothetical protein DRP07_00080 [Archaeoglobales archaeon]
MRGLMVLVVLAVVSMMSIAVAQTQADPGLITPNSPLYQLDIWFDNLKLMFSPNKALTAVGIMNERIAEYQLTQSNAAIDDYLDKMNTAKIHASDTTTKQIVEEVISQHVNTLKQVRQKVPDEAKKAIDRAINESQRVIDVIKKVLQPEEQDVIQIDIPTSVKVGENVTASWTICNPFNSTLEYVVVKMHIRKADFSGIIVKRDIEETYSLNLAPGACKSDSMSITVPETIWGVPTRGTWIAVVEVVAEPQDVVIYHTMETLQVS